MKYSIKYLTYDDIIELKDISTDEYNSIRESVDFILFFYGFHELFDIVRRNIYEFWKLYFETSEQHRLKVIYGEDIIKPIPIFNQRLANILTSFKSYEDHLKRQISDSNINNKEYLDSFNYNYKMIYDEYFSFRFFARLRNFVQHFGFPIKKIKYSQECVSELIEHKIQLIAFKSDLLKYKKWSHVKHEIEILKEEIDIRLYLNEFLFAFSSFHKKMADLFLNHFLTAENKLNEIKKMCIQDSTLKFQKITKDIELIYVTSFDGFFTDSKIWLPYPRFSDIHKYLLKNIFSESLKISYSTNK